MGWREIPKPTPVPPGQWENYCSVNFDSWMLRCPPVFVAGISRSGAQFYLEINSKGFGPRASLEMAQIDAEMHIAFQIKEMLPVYKLIVERIERRRDSIVIPIRPKP